MSNIKKKLTVLLSAGLFLVGAGCGNQKIEKGQVKEIVKLEVYPDKVEICPTESEGSVVGVIAKYSNNTSKDVTTEVIFESENANIAFVDPLKHRVVSGLEQGETVIIAKYIENDIEKTDTISVSVVDEIEMNK